MAYQQHEHSREMALDADDHHTDDRHIEDRHTDDPLAARPQPAPVPVLAETVHELARQLGEVQERAARAEADAEALRHRLADAEQAVTGPEPPTARPAADGPERHASLWLAANRQFLRTLPGAAAREAAGARLAGGRSVEPARRARPWRRWR